MSEPSPPANWKDLSYDHRLFMVFFGVLFVLFALGSFPISVSAGVTIAGAATLVTLSVIHRVRHHWRWPGAGPKQIGMAILSVVLGTVFLLAAIPLLPPTTLRALPWYLGGASIVAYNVLVSLRVIAASETEFLSHCGLGSVRSIAPAAPKVPRARQMFRLMSYAFFLAAWLTFLAFFWRFGVAYEAGTTQPTAERTEPLISHGRTVYISKEEKRVVSVLEVASMIAIPSAILLVLLQRLTDGAAAKRQRDDDDERDERTKSD